MGKTIVLADDHAFTADGMRSALQRLTDFEIVAVARNGVEAIAHIKQFQPDCALLDDVMPGVTGYEAFVEARRWSPKTRFAIVTGSIAPKRFADIASAEIDGIFLKNMDAAEICQGLEQMMEGEQQIGENVQKLIDEGINSATLTSREVEVLHGIARGFSNAEIATSLSVSPKTIDSHRTSLMRKLGVHNTAALLVRSMRDGLIDV